MNNFNPKEEILKLKDGECWVWPESDYGKAEVWKINNVYILFEIPMYGGEPRFNNKYRLEYINEMIKEIKSWT